MPATDKMNNLDTVLIVKQSRRPVVTANYVPVDFDRDSRWFKTEARYQRVDGQAFRKLAGLSVDLNSHDAKGLSCRAE
jgi:hypothetical protein